jgi:hypothetical protein
MALNKEKVQDLIDDFVVNNVDQINEVSNTNPILYDAVIDALNLLSRKFGNVQTINVPKPAAPIQPETPKGTTLNPLVYVGAKFTGQENKNTFIVNNVDLKDKHGNVNVTKLETQTDYNLTFVFVNELIESGEWVPKKEDTQDIISINVGLNPVVQVGAKFTGQNNETYTIIDIDSQNSRVTYQQSGKATIYPTTFDNVNSYILHGLWVPKKQNKTMLNPIVQVGAIFKLVNVLIKIESIDNNNEIVEYSNEGKKRLNSTNFQQINARIDDGSWVLVSLNPIVQKGTTFLDVEDDVRFSVNAIRQSNSDVLITWENDPVMEYIPFEEFNDYIESAAWVVAPTKTQGTNTEAEILEAIEGLQLLDDDDSKKEIIELKKQLKQLKNKKP